MEERRIIDCHTHILPGIDDGSENIEMTKKLLELEMNNGVTDIVFTPHFYASRNSIGSFLDKREKSLEKVLGIVNETGVTPENFYVGAEVYYFEGMSKAEELSKLCISGTDYLLIEMPFAGWTKKNIDEIESIIEDRNLNVIIAHIERFYKFQKNKEFFEKLLELELMIQLNGEVFLEGFLTKRWADKFISDKANIILGSDCHNLTTRKPNLADARSKIGKKHGQVVLDKIDENSKKILGL